MESKIVMAEDWVHKYYHGNQSDILHLVKLAQKQAIEATLEVASENAEIISGGDDNVWGDTLDKGSILGLKDSEELKVL